MILSIIYNILQQTLSNVFTDTYKNQKYLFIFRYSILYKKIKHYLHSHLKITNIISEEGFQYQYHEFLLFFCNNLNTDNSGFIQILWSIFDTAFRNIK